MSRLRLLGIRLLPAAATAAWFTPPSLGRSARARDAAALEGLTESGVGETRIYSLGTGPLVLALHGWGGRPAQMAPMARRLARSGFRVLIPDLPGRAGGDRTDIKAVAAAVTTIVRHLGRPTAVVAHSFGAMTLRLVPADLLPPVGVYLAPALTATDAVTRFAEQTRMLPWTRRGLLRRLARWDRRLWPMVAGLTPEQLPGVELLVVHDPDDADTPFAASERLAVLRPGTTLVPVAGVGHMGILEDAGVAGVVGQFIESRLQDRVG